MKLEFHCFALYTLGVNCEDKKFGIVAFLHLTINPLIFSRFVSNTE
jgi:hypothetical protein